MRELTVLGLADTGHAVVCEDPATHERFLIAADDRLAATVPGHPAAGAPTGEQREPAVADDADSQLTPRDIQSRIRAGAPLEDVAAAAGVRPERIERFAFPVLAERSAMAGKGRLAHPHGADRTVEAIVTETLGNRGQLSELAWDAVRDERGWALVLSWSAGRSQNRAHWSFAPAGSGGTVTPRDDHARDLLDPTPRPLRTIGSPPARPAAPAAPPQTMEVPQPSAPVPAVEVHQRMIEDTVIDERSGARTVVSETVIQTRAVEVRTGTDSPRPRKSARPVMPSWEDVLLGGAKPAP